MILDNLLLFTGTSNGASGGITSSAYADAPTTGTQVASNIIDLGLSGLPSSANGGGARDMGVGDDPMLKLSAIVGTAFADGTNMYLILAGAPDDGTGSPGSYTTMWTSPTYLEATMVAGAQLANVDIPRVIAGQVLPRFLRLSFVTSGTHTAGTVQANIVLDRDDQIIGTGGVYSGYQAGVTVAN
jgi:hypothetical protein